MHELILSLLLLGTPLAATRNAQLPGYCQSDECRSFESVKRANLCGSGAGAAAAWVDDPFEPSVTGVAFYDRFDLASLVERFGQPTKRSRRKEHHPDRDPTTPATEEMVEFHRYEFSGLTLETATLGQHRPRVTLIEISSPGVALKCNLRLGLPLTEYQSRLALPAIPERKRQTPRHCPIFYDLYDIPYDQGDGLAWGDNSTLCFYPDEEGRVVRILWDKTRWVSGYH